MPQKKIYFKDKKKVKGPFLPEQVLELVAQGSIRRSTLVCLDVGGSPSGSWRPAKSIKGLFPVDEIKAPQQVETDSPARRVVAKKTNVVLPKAKSQNFLVIGGVLFVVIVLIAAISFVVWYSGKRDEEKIAAANRRVQSAVSHAESWLRDPSSYDIEVVERKLDAAIRQKLATNLDLAKQIKPQVVAKKEKNKLEAEAQKQFLLAKSLIQDHEIAEAISALDLYIASNHAVEKNLARSIREQAIACISNERALEVLEQMTDESIISIASKGVSSDPLIKDDDLLSCWNKNLIHLSEKVLVRRQKQREAARIAEERRIRLEKERRIAELRLQKEREEAARKQREIEEKRRAESAARFRKMIVEKIKKRNEQIATEVSRAMLRYPSRSREFQSSMQILIACAEVIRKVDRGEVTTEWARDPNGGSLSLVTAKIGSEIEDLFHFTRFDEMSVKVNDKWIKMEEVWQRTLRIMQGLD